MIAQYWQKIIYKLNIFYIKSHFNKNDIDINYNDETATLKYSRDPIYVDGAALEEFKNIFDGDK